jgi:hypothetical protein
MTAEFIFWSVLISAITVAAWVVVCELLKCIGGVDGT